MTFTHENHFKRCWFKANAFDAEIAHTAWSGTALALLQQPLCETCAMHSPAGAGTTPESNLAFHPRKFRNCGMGKRTDCRVLVAVVVILLLLSA